MFFPTSSRSWWNAKPFSGNAQPQRWAAKYLGHTWYIGKRFFKSTASSSAPHPQESNPCGSIVSQNTSPQVMSESHTPSSGIRDASQDRQPKTQPSLVREDFQRIMGQTNNDCRFQILTLTNSPRQQRSPCWKIRFKTEVCTCSQFPTEAMMWIKEVEMVESVDDL